MKNLITLIYIIVFSFCAAGQENLSIEVQDADGTNISYAEIRTGKYFFLTDENGVLNIPDKYIHKNDTLTVSSLGFKNAVLIINDASFKDLLKITLTEKEYDLDEVLITTDFDAFSFFRERQTWKAPKINKHTVHCIAKYDYIKNGIYETKCDTVSFKYTSHLKDTTMLSYIIRAMQLSLNIPTFYSDRYYQKKSKFKYLGLQDEQRVFEIDMPDKTKHSGDTFVTQVYIDKNGRIKDETRYIVNKSNGFISYLMKSEYKTDSKQHLLPTKSTFTLFIPQKNNKNKNLNNQNLEWGSEVHIELQFLY